jgi:hypothetical protein
VSRQEVVTVVTPASLAPSLFRLAALMMSPALSASRLAASPAWAPSLLRLVVAALTMSALSPPPLAASMAWPALMSRRQPPVTSHLAIVTTLPMSLPPALLRLAAVVLTRWLALSPFRFAASMVWAVPMSRQQAPVTLHLPVVTTPQAPSHAAAVFYRNCASLEAARAQPKALAFVPSASRYVTVVVPAAPSTLLRR